MSNVLALPHRTLQDPPHQHKRVAATQTNELVVWALLKGSCSTNVLKIHFKHCIIPVYTTQSLCALFILDLDHVMSVKLILYSNSVRKIRKVSACLYVIIFIWWVTCNKYNWNYANVNLKCFFSPWDPWNLLNDITGFTVLGTVFVI